MRIAARLELVIDARLLGQLADAQLGVVQHVEIDLGAALFALAHGVHRVRRASQQHVGHDVGQLAGHLLVEATLRDPRRAQADTAGVHRVLVAGDGVAVDHDADDVEDARGLVAAQLGAIFALDRGRVHVDQVRVGAAEGHAQSALGELVGHGGRILEGLLLQLLELFGLRQLEGQRQRGEHVDVRSALLTGEDGLVDLLRDGRIRCQ